MTESIEDRLRTLGIALPPVSAPVANYVPYVIAGNLLFVSGQGPKAGDGRWQTGKVGAEVTLEQAYEHARLAGIGVLAAARAALGTLDRVAQVVKLVGFVNSIPTFKDHPKVINGCSDLMVKVFADAGRHARSAVGVGSLPENISVEVEAIFAIR